MSRPIPAKTNGKASGSITQRLSGLMGGAFSSSKKLPHVKETAKSAVPSSGKAVETTKTNRRLSTAVFISNISKGNMHETIAKGNNEYLRFHSLSSAGYEPDNIRKTNQDAFISISEFQGDPAMSFFGVFDGHGASGHLVSGYVINEIPKLINKDVLRKESEVPTDKAENVGRMLTQAFEKVNNTLEADKSIDSSLSGTTAVAGFVLGSKENGRKIVMANAGDSRAILAYEENGKLKVKELSEDQNPDRDDERRRILSCGGRVEPLMDENGEAIGPYRVWLPNMMLPGLAMARSIGDDIAATVGVHATPEVRVHHITEKDKFMVICSDGVWEFLSNEDVVGIVQVCV